MEIFSIGPLELFFILLIALIVLGPQDMIKTGRTIGRFLNKLVRSSTWKTIQRTTQELRQLPTYLMREANLEEAIKDLPTPESIKKETSLDDLKSTLSQTNQDLSDWLQPPSLKLDSSPETGEYPSPDTESSKN
jgi:Sec-independent protein translocase protein TatA